MAGWLWNPRKTRLPTLEESRAYAQRVLRENAANEELLTKNYLLALRTLRGHASGIRHLMQYLEAGEKVS